MFLFVAGMAVWVLGFVPTVVWRDFDFIGIKQTKGHVFWWIRVVGWEGD
jgi:hypothetical protein